MAWKGMWEMTSPASIQAHGVAYLVWKLFSNLAL